MSKNLRWDAERQRWVSFPEPSGGAVSVRSVSAYPIRSFTVLGFLIALMLTAIFVLPGGILTADDSPDDKDDQEGQSVGGDVSGGAFEPDVEDPMTSPPEDAPTQGADEGEGEEGPAPDGYSVREDDQGFLLHVPEDWSRAEELSQDGVFKVFFTPNARRNFIQVRSFGPEVASPGRALERLENEAESLPGFDRKERNTGEGQGADGVLSYRYEHDAHGPFQVFARALLGEDGEVYAILSAGPEPEYNGVHGRFVGSAYSFRAVGDDRF